MSCCPQLFLSTCIASSLEQSTPLCQWCVTIAVGSSGHGCDCTKGTSDGGPFPSTFLLSISKLSMPVGNAVLRCQGEVMAQRALRIVGGHCISSLLLLPAYILSQKQCYWLIIKMFTCMASGTAEQVSFLYNFSFIQIFEMHNIRIHLYFALLREIRFFQKHNDGY